MQQVIADQVQKTRDQMKNFADEARKGLDARRSALEGRADEARKTAQRMIRDAQLSVVETTREVVARAADAVEPADEATGLLAKATALGKPAHDALARSEEALTERLVALRAASEDTLPVPEFDELSVKNVVAALDAGDFDAVALRTLRAYEVANKDRVTLLRELDARLEALAPAPEATEEADQADDAPDVAAANDADEDAQA